MIHLHTTALLLALGAVGPRASSDADRAVAPTPAEYAIAEAREAVDRDAEDGRAWVRLAHAHARRARECADPAQYALAGEAVARALALDERDFEAQKAQAWILLGRHEFARARDLARELNRRVPDDVQVYGFLVDANAELGDYAAAERAAQWMLDLRPGNLAGLTRAAYLRELFGDPEGAIELFEMAFVQVGQNEREERAWILTHIAHLRLATGAVERAETVLEQALAIFPDYHYALARMADVRTLQGRHEDAVALLRTRLAGAPHPENRWDLALALRRAGHPAEAEAELARFEEEARAEMDGQDNANRELVRCYVERAAGGDADAAAEALRIAERDAARRADVHTLHVLALALEANGEHDRAREAIERALAVGIEDAVMLADAGAISLAQGDPDAARRFLERSLRAAPRSPSSTEAKQRLARLGEG